MSWLRTNVKTIDEVRVALQQISGILADLAGNAHARVFVKTTAPTVNDDLSQGYAAGDRWIDQTGEAEYVAIKTPTGAALWKQTTP